MFGVIRGPLHSPLLVVYLLQTLIACGSQDPSFVSKESRVPESAKSGGTLDAAAGTPAETAATTETNDAAAEDETPESAPAPLPAEKSKLANAIIKAETESELSWQGISESSLTTERAETLFQNGQITTQEMAISLAEKRRDVRITMTREIREELKSFRQIVRPEIMDVFVQGDSGNQKTESFRQKSAGNGILDLVIVIDNSGSMAEEQKNLSTKLNPLLSYIAESDWRIGIVTTDYRNGCMRELIRKGDAGINDTFSRAIQAGTSGSGNEEGIRMAVEALQGKCLNSEWVRASSTIAVLIVSDEDNCSNGNGCAGKSWKDQTYLTDYLGSIRQVGTNARIYGLFWHPSLARSACSSAANTGRQYADAVTATGGTWGSICDTDYTTTLSAISRDIATILDSQFALQQAPDQNSARVFLNDILQTSGYEIIGNILKFNTPPPSGADIRIEYRYGATRIYSEFALSKPAVPESISVRVNGQAVNPQEFTYDRNTREIIFTQPPADNTMLNVYFKEDIPLYSSFPIGNDAIENSIAVTTDGAAVEPGAYSYETSTGMLKFLNPPRENSRTEVSFRSFGDPVLVYPYAARPGQMKVGVSDAETGSMVSSVFSQGMLIFPPEEFQPGRNIIIADPESRENLETVILPATPISVVLKSDGARCSAPDTISFVGTKLDLSRCNLAEGTSEVVLEYEFISDTSRTFKVDPGFFTKPHNVQIWRVWVNGRITTDYEVSSNSVSLNSEPDPLAEIRIQVSLLREI